MAGVGVRLAVLDRLPLGRVERFPIGAAPSLVRIALREGTAAMWLHGLNLTARRPAILYRHLLRASRGRLIAARTVTARRLIIGNSAIFGMGWRRIPEE